MVRNASYTRLDDVTLYKDRIRTNTLDKKDQMFYRWDSFHKDIEIYDNRGRDMGSVDPVTGKIYRPGTMKIEPRLQRII